MGKLWFKRKRYGWGWYPSTWEGWLLLAIYLVLTIGSVYIVEWMNLSEIQSAYTVMITVTILTIILLIICYKKGESPKWQWGEDKSSVQKPRE